MFICFEDSVKQMIHELIPVAVCYSLCFVWFWCKNVKKKQKKPKHLHICQKHFNSWAGFVANGIFPIIIFRVFVLMFMLKGK